MRKTIFLPRTAHLARLVGCHLRDTQPELSLTEKELLCLELAGLCHDLGHGPFSHLWEHFYHQGAKDRGLKPQWTVSSTIPTLSQDSDAVRTTFVEMVIVLRTTLHYPAQTRHSLSKLGYRAAETLMNHRESSTYRCWTANPVARLLPWAPHFVLNGSCLLFFLFNCDALLAFQNAKDQLESRRHLRFHSIRMWREFALPPCLFCHSVTFNF